MKDNEPRRGEMEGSVRSWILVCLCLIIALTACSANAEEPTRVAAQLETPAFPPIWTLTPQPPTQTLPTTEQGFLESETPTPTPTPTHTPTTTVERTPPPTSSVDFSKVRCTASTQEDGIELLQVPYFQDSHILPTMEPGYIYQAVELYPTLVRLTRGGQTAGWVDYRSLALDFDGPDCLYQSTYPGGITDFDDYLCFIVADPPADTYLDQDLAVSTGSTIGSTPQYVLSTMSSGPHVTCVGHAGPCFFVDASAVETIGRCHDLPRSAETISETQLMSQPNPSTSSPIYLIPAGKIVIVQNESVSGPPPANAPADGLWLLVKLYVQNEPLAGWVWSAHIKYR